MKVLLLSYYFPPDREIGAARPGRLVKGLSANDFDVQVIARATLPVHPQGGAAPAVYRVADDHTSIVKVIRRVMPYNDRIEWRSPAFRMAATRIRLERPDVIVSTAPPFSVNLAAAALSKEFGIPWVADLRDPIVDNPFRGRRWAKPLDHWTESMLVRQATRVVVNTAEAGKTLSARYTAHARKIEVIWNGFDPDDGLEPVPLRMPGKIIVSHVGAVYGARHPGAFLSSLARLIDDGRVQPRSIQVEFVGPFEQTRLSLDGPLCGKLKDLGVLTVLPQMVSPERARLLTASSSHLLLLDQNDANVGIQVPGKLFDYLRVGRPILSFSAANSMSHSILSKSGVPFIQITGNDGWAEIDSRVLEFLKLSPEPSALSPWFLDSFTLSTQTKQWLRVISEAVRGDVGNDPPRLRR